MCCTVIDLQQFQPRGDGSESPSSTPSSDYCLGCWNVIYTKSPEELRKIEAKNEATKKRIRASGICSREDRYETEYWTLLHFCPKTTEKPKPKPKPKTETKDYPKDHPEDYPEDYPEDHPEDYPEEDTTHPPTTHPSPYYPGKYGLPGLG